MRRVRKKMKNNKTQRGFTLIEILVVIVILAVIGSIAVLSYNRVQRGIRDKLAQTRLAIFADAQTRFRVGLGRGRYAGVCELSRTMSSTGERLIGETTAKFDAACVPIEVDTWAVRDEVVNPINPAADTTLRRGYLMFLNSSNSPNFEYCMGEDGVLRRGAASGDCTEASEPVE